MAAPRARKRPAAKKAAPAKPKSKVIERYEGSDVVATVIVVKGASDGLSKPLQVEPVKIHKGDTGYLLLKWECTEVGYKGYGDSPNLLVRKQIVQTQIATIVDAEFAEEAIEAQIIAVERAQGVERLPLGQSADVEDDEEGE